MQMHDTLRKVQGASIADELAAAFNLSRAQANAIVRTAHRQFAWHLEKNTLSRGGLADLVEAFGSGHHAQYLASSEVFSDAATQADGKAILGHILGSKDKSRAVAASIARQAGLNEALVRSMLPGLAAVTMAGIAAQARSSLGPILAQMPSLERWSRGNPYADLADVLRRKCGVGRYASGKLRREVRAGIARAAGFPRRGALGWYAQFIVARLAASLLRRPLAALLATPRLNSQ
jgi:hypothetical protein